MGKDKNKKKMKKLKDESCIPVKNPVKIKRRITMEIKIKGKIWNKHNKAKFLYPIHRKKNKENK